MVLKPVSYEAGTDTVSSGEVMVFVGDSFVVAVRHGDCAPLGEVRRIAGHPFKERGWL